MIETVAPVSTPVPRPRSRKPSTVSAPALALHLDCSRTYISRLEAEGVIQRQGDGFPLDRSRVDYLRYLRRKRRQSPRLIGIVPPAADENKSETPYSAGTPHSPENCGRNPDPSQTPTVLPN
jgi:hypothetical protein